MKKFIQSWFINTLAVLVAVYVVNGIHYRKPLDLCVASLLLGILNAILRPIIMFLALPLLSDPLKSETFLRAAEIYRQGRRKGYTIRSSVDCLIAAIAIENRVPIWHRDRDFGAIARYTALEVLLRR